MHALEQCGRISAHARRVRKGAGEQEIGLQQEPVPFEFQFLVPGSEALARHLVAHDFARCVILQVYGLQDLRLRTRVRAQGAIQHGLVQVHRAIRRRIPGI
jgi:hypothetical protein